MNNCLNCKFYNEDVQTINREHTKRLVELMKEQGMTLSDYEISICKELGIGF